MTALVGLHVEELSVRARAGDGATATRLAAVATGLPDALADALTALGVGAEEHLLVQEVVAEHRVPAARLAGSDMALVRAWADDVAGALVASAAVSAPGAAVLRYRNDGHALVDLLCRAGRGDLDRRWAWERLGLVVPATAGSPAAVAVAALTARPALAVGALLAVAPDRTTLPALGLDWDDWTAIARSVADRPGFTSSTRRAAPAAPLTRPGGSALPEGSEILDGHVPMSAPAAALVAALDQCPLALVLAEAARRARPRPGALAAVAALAVRAAAPGADPTEAEVAIAAEVLAGLGASPSRPAGTKATAPVKGESTAVTDRWSADAAPRSPEVPQPEPPQPDLPQPELPQPELPRSAVAGLLFLLHVVAELDLPGAMAERLGGRPPSWSYRQLGVALAGTADDDPAVLAFAGLPPAGADLPDPPTADLPDPPTADLPDPPTAEEAAVLGGLAGDVRDAVARRLPALAVGPPEELTAWVCRRRAVLAADPGWVTAHLALDDVDLDIRRAGLDLDPGFVPWLGTVVRFVYGSADG